MSLAGTFPRPLGLRVVLVGPAAGLLPFRNQRRGQSITEVAIVLPIFAILLFGGFHVGRIAAYRTRSTAVATGVARVMGMGSDWKAPAGLDVALANKLVIANGLDHDDVRVTVTAGTPYEGGAVLEAALEKFGTASGANSADLLRLVDVELPPAVEVRMFTTPPRYLEGAWSEMRVRRPIPGRTWKNENVSNGVRNALQKVAQRVVSQGGSIDAQKGVLKIAVPKTPPPNPGGK